MVLITVNGGESWVKKYIDNWRYTDRIVMTDSLRGYMIHGGVPVKLLKTADAFDTCTIHNLDSYFTVEALSLINDSTGYYLNNETRLRKFEHSGTSFTHVIDTLSVARTCNS